MADFADLGGKILTKIENNGDELVFFVDGVRRYRLVHYQDCCEHVSIESIVGDLDDLIGHPITLAEEVCGDTPADYTFENEPESYTWTFYKLATVKGYVDIRWLGESNGYYSEGVTFEEMTQW